MAAIAARELQDPKLAKVQPSKTSYRRWIAGNPPNRGAAAIILQWYFGKSARALAQVVPMGEIVQPRPLDRRTHTTARILDYNWSASRHVPGEPSAGIHGAWELRGRHFDGTTIGVQVYDAEVHNDVAQIAEADLPHLKSFVRSSRRGVVLTSLEAAGENGLYVMDSALARRSLVLGRSPAVPLAYRLDDLTFALLWALHVLDDGLLADDRPLAEHAKQLQHYVNSSTSAPPRSDMPDLSPIGAAWLGSSLCAQYIAQRLDELSIAPAFWTRERTGEEYAPWLFFGHKHEYIQALTSRFKNGDLSYVFCIPRPSESDTEPYEHILLLLTVAMMEMHGITVWVSNTTGHAHTEGFALGRDRAIVANWVREESVWRVATTTASRDLASYQEAIVHAREYNVLDGNTTCDRLQALAVHLDLDWDWLTSRCQALSREGISSMLRPRSRLVKLDAVDQTLRFISDVASQDGGTNLTSRDRGTLVD